MKTAKGVLGIFMIIWGPIGGYSLSEHYSPQNMPILSLAVFLVLLIIPGMLMLYKITLSNNSG
ncbi:unnamed protein product [marine sediment metagenome]|uniref:Uncharacterized protein n=1 Tax=marine sediment metagenome TaxID=412755 RepID=X1SBH4_9ZZZZ